MSKTTDRTAENPNTPAPLAVGAVVRVSRLDDLRHVRAEIGRVYREARRREGRYPDALTAQRLANVLAHVRTLIELEDVVRRLDEIEGKVGRGE